MRTLHKTLLACALAGVAALALLRRDADASAAPPAAPPAAIVAVAPAVDIAFAPMHWAPGGVISRRDARVAGEQPGRVARIASVGQTVAAGDPVAVLDDTSLRLREREIEAESARIRSQLEMARLQETRYAALAGTQSIARAQYDQVRADRDMLAQDHARAQAQLAQVRHQRSQMVVRAPFDGVVAEQYAQAGEYLVPGGAVVRVVDTGAREIRVRAPVGFAAQLPPGTAVQVRDGDRIHALHVSAQVPVGDEASRQMELRIDVDGRTWPVGTALEVGMPRAAARTVVAVPRDAVVLRREGSYVLRIGDNGTAERLGVVTGEEIDGLVEVDGAVRPGDNVVVRGAERVAPGQAVSVEPPALSLAAR
ncbi:efflux RND transporter periplasmic adaptor subunit [Luteimonas aestuarii]|uniref:Efflux RND transporter periplasmic adaptor subunit n=1 Tax=Luteimonas aestuarii TaxID=453837 RepID=A0A4R5U3X2_9GAMM|nr:efflux RND transporter periplasmic adaptor subunit [Luteimonas aestuarii]TDK28411.1 efflux RND transporter periplasmic adaptor subunit [Luteimonas aestuarii]